MHKPLFYQGVDEFTANVLSNVGEEIQQVVTALKTEVPHLAGIRVPDGIHEWLLYGYRNQIQDCATVKTCCRTNLAYDELCHPVAKVEGRYLPDFAEHRYLTEDIPGLSFCKGLAELLHVPTPVMDTVIYNQLNHECQR